MNQEQLIDEYGKRLDVYDERLNTYDKILGEHQKILGEYGMSLFGDDRLNVKGLVESMRETNDALKGLLAWKDELGIYWRTAQVAMRLGLLLLAIIGGGVWWPQISALLKLLGG